MDDQAKIKEIRAAVECFITKQHDAGQPFSDEQVAKFRRIVEQAIALAAQPYHYENDREFSSKSAGIFVMPGDRREGPRYTPDQLGKGVARDLKRAGLGKNAADLIGDLLRDFERGCLQDHTP